MRLIIALLIATLAGVGMGYSFGYTRNVQLKRTAAQPIFQPWEFDDFYADPATRPTTTRPVVITAHRPPPR